ncbi:hypothetical protein CLHUN_41230 [Ruminiclostridium hungatei]|uniref:Uncharacterized protein n=1 Tax=Ruminiclostridium hungatei TaxID=48256 RepID=A0A1V4SDS8_RUMHU|nr:hypothetical protein [Ruminiclostridium hungatei]OPX42008.1 hypothetical protein CLHUN_41230 [Ruminiclostridium hungatei]
MKNGKIVVAVFAAAFLLFISGCGSNLYEVKDAREVPPASATNPEVQSEAAAAEDTAEEVIPPIPVPDRERVEEKLTGKWLCIDEAGRYAAIAKSGNTYVYEDNEGKYPAVFKAGVLEIKVSESETAKAYLDENTGNLILEYQESMWEYSRE